MLVTNLRAGFSYHARRGPSEPLCARGFFRVMWVLVALLLPLGVSGAPPASTAQPAKPRHLSIVNKPWRGDFDKLFERRMIRVLVPHSRTLYFNDRGHERGLSAELARDFERHINRKHKTAKRPITVYLIPTTRDRLLSDVAAGLGDVAAGNLTITEDRLKVVDFVLGEGRKRVAEVVLTGPKSPEITSADDLAGKKVHVRKASSYYESLVALNERLAKEGKSPVVLVLVPDALEDEDLMEMLNAGLLQAIVVDDWKAAIWAQILPAIKINQTATLREGGVVGWAIRKGSPLLSTELADFYQGYVKKQGVADYRLKQFSKHIKQIKNPTESEEWRRFEETLALFERYGAQYNFDPLMLAAQGFQESQLDQNRRSHVGAIGIMQIMPATGAGLKVGDIRVTEANIHAGTKYMDQLMSKYFPGADFSEGNRPLFAFASYNAGPARIARLRGEAKQRGLDPNKWFNNVELVVAEKVGQETTTYVRNIYKYYVSYRLQLEAHRAQQAALEQVAPTAAP